MKNSNSEFAPLLKTVFFTILSIAFVFGVVAFAGHVAQKDADYNAAVWEVAKTYPNPYLYYGLHKR